MLLLHPLLGLLFGAMTAAGRASSPPNTCRAPAPDDSSLVGIWGAEESYGPLVRGELTVLQRAGRWEAHIAGFEISPRTAGDSIWVVMPAGQGEFRGRVLPDSQAIAGFWIQPAGVVGSVSYASPLRLVQTDGARRTRVWRGSVVPLADRFSLYLVARRRPDGSVIGSFHNPEANSRGGAAAFAIDRKGTTVRFVDTTSDRSRAAPVILASYDSAQHQLVVPWADLGRPIVLSRRSCEDAVGLYPRTPADLNYRYRAPLPGNGWAAVRAESAGLNEERLAELVRYIAGGDPEVDTTPLIHSVLVARHGRLVLEEYFFGYDEGRPHDLRSASKTFASVLVGAAIMHGASIRPSTPVYPLFHNEAPFANPDPRKQQITLGQLMTHSTGLACDDNGDALPGNEDVMQSQQAQPDWYKFTLDLPMIHDPGERYGYCSATMNLVGGVLAAAEQRWLPAMFDEWVAGPLEFQRYYVNLTPTGQAYFGGGMQLVPRDLLKLGTTYLDGGVWNGRRIVTKAWIEQSTAKQIGPPQATSPDGYAWHLHTLTSGGHEYREYEANGNGGQFLIVLPDLDLAVVLTGADYGRYRIWRQWRDALVPDYVIAAVADPR